MAGLNDLRVASEPSASVTATQKLNAALRSVDFWLARIIAIGIARRKNDGAGSLARAIEQNNGGAGARDSGRCSLLVGGNQQISDCAAGTLRQRRRRRCDRKYR